MRDKRAGRVGDRAGQPNLTSQPLYIQPTYGFNHFNMPYPVNNMLCSHVIPP